MNIKESTIRYSLDRYYSMGVFEGKKVCIFPINSFTGFIMNTLHCYGIETEIVFDNNSTISKFWGITVVKPTLLEDKDDWIFIIASMHFNSMEKQLIEFGYAKQDIVCLLNMSYQRWIEKDYVENVYKIRFGYYVYRRIKRIIGNKKAIFFPSASLGDTYLPARYLKNFLRGEYEYAIVVAEISKDILNVFDNLSYITLSLEEARAFEKIYWSFFSSFKEITYMHTTPNESFQVGIGYEMISATGYAFAEAFPKQILKNERKSVALEQPWYYSDDILVRNLFEKNNLIVGKNLFISPYTNTMKALPLSLWEKIVEYALDHGFSVCTNSASEKEPPIKGSVPIFCELCNLRKLVEMSGYAIMARSGISDFLGAINANKLVLYTDERYSFASIFSFNDLKKDHIDDTAEQLILYDDKIEKMTEDVFLVMDKWGM